jgi:hypothetical protein
MQQQVRKEGIEFFLVKTFAGALQVRKKEIFLVLEINPSFSEPIEAELVHKTILAYTILRIKNGNGCQPLPNLLTLKATRNDQRRRKVQSL